MHIREAYNNNTPPHSTTRSPQLRCKKKKRHKHDYQYWLAEPYNHARGETSLWVAVITQAVMDALSKSRNPEMLYHKQEAIHWLTENNKDFITVCLYAGMDPDYVRQKAKRAITCPTPWRAEPGKGKRYAERKAYRQRLKKQKAKEESPTLLHYSSRQS